MNGYGHMICNVSVYFLKEGWNLNFDLLYLLPFYVIERNWIKDPCGKDALKTESFII